MCVVKNDSLRLHNALKTFDGPDHLGEIRENVQSTMTLLGDDWPLIKESKESLTDSCTVCHNKASISMHRIHCMPMK